MIFYTAETFQAALGKHNVPWRFEDNAIRANFIFSDFKTAFAFMTQVAVVAERLHHHPDWQNSYNRVAISLRTHDQNAVTDLDIALAKEIDSLYTNPQ